MIKVTFALLMALVLAISDDRIDFVFEVVRHGARAPSGSEGFKVGDHQLTAQGMRQRYLLGAFYRQRYVEEYGLLSEEYDPDEIFMTSTNVNRTIQSGQSELMGLYPPGATLEQISSQVRMNLQQNGIGLPPFQVRNVDQINEQLGSNALPFGIVNMPISSNIVPQFNDDVEIYSCQYPTDVDNARFAPDSTYDRFIYLIPALREPMKVNFNMTEEQADAMNYMTLYGEADTVQSELFEGIPQAYDFSDEDLHNINMTQVGTLVEPITPYANSIWMSKMLRSPMKKMEMAVQQTLSGSVNSEQFPESWINSKFEIFSAHDYTLGSLIKFMNATNSNFTDLPFASQINIELHHSEDCLTSSDRGEDCFWVETRYNGIMYEFPTCGLDVQGKRTQCTYSQFREYMESIYVETTTDYVEECSLKYSPE